MSCKHLKVNNPQKIQGFGTQSDIVVTANCALKQTGQANMLAIYQRLFEMGIEKSGVSTSCPFFPSKDFSTCPYYEQDS